MIMPIFTGIYGAFVEFFNMLAWRDIVEIAVIFTGIYSFLVWVGKDVQKPLLLYCYLYGALIAFSYCFYLPVIYYVAILFLPVCLVIGILLHQATLQRNFVSFYSRALVSQNTSSHEWQEELIRVALVAHNQKKGCFFVIENNNPLNDFLDIPYYLRAEITKDFLIFLIDSVGGSEHIFLISSSLIIAIDSHWKFACPAKEYGDMTKLTENELCALSVSAHTDSLIIYTQPGKPGLNGIANGILTQNLSGQQATVYLKQYYKNHIPAGHS